MQDTGDAVVSKMIEGTKALMEYERQRIGEAEFRLREAEERQEVAEGFTRLITTTAGNRRRKRAREDQKTKATAKRRDANKRARKQRKGGR